MDAILSWLQSYISICLKHNITYQYIQYVYKSCGQFLDGKNTITDKAQVSNMFNNFFTNNSVNLANQIPKSNHKPRKYLEGSYLHNMFYKQKFPLSFLL